MKSSLLKKNQQKILRYCHFHFICYFRSCTYITRKLLKLLALYQVPSAVAAVVESAAVGSKKKKRTKKLAASVTPSASEMPSTGDDGSESTSVQLQPSSSYAFATRSCSSFAENYLLIAGGRQQSQLFQCLDLLDGCLHLRYNLT